MCSSITRTAELNNACRFFLFLSDPQSRMPAADSPCERRKPVLIDRFHLTHPQPCQTIPAFSHERASVRGRSGPDEGLPEVGAYLRVSGP